MGDLAAIPFPDGDQERMELVEEPRVRRQMGLEELARGFVAEVGGEEAVPGENPARVRVRDEHRPPSRIQQNRVDGFRSEPRHAEQLAPERGERRAPQSVESAGDVGPEPARDGLQPSRLHPMRPGRPDQPGQLRLGHVIETPGDEQALRAETSLERGVESQQARLDPVARRTGNPAPARENRA